MKVKKYVDGDRVSRRDLLDRRCHRFDVPQDFGSGDVGWLVRPCQWLLLL